MLVFQKISSKTYVLDLNPMVRDYLKRIQHVGANVGKTEVWVARNLGGGNYGRWGKTIAVAGSEAEVKMLAEAKGDIKP